MKNPYPSKADYKIPMQCHTQCKEKVLFKAQVCKSNDSSKKLMQFYLFQITQKCFPTPTRNPRAHCRKLFDTPYLPSSPSLTLCNCTMRSNIKYMIMHIKIFNCLTNHLFVSKKLLTQPLSDSYNITSCNACNRTAKLTYSK